MSNTPESCSTPAEAAKKRISGNRFAIALACWLLSSLGIFLSLMLAASGIAALLRQPLLQGLQNLTVYAGLAIVYAWVALGVMTHGWLRNQPVHWHWPLLGTLISIFCLSLFPQALLLVAPCVLLAGYLVYFHGTTPAPHAGEQPHA